MYDLIGDIHGHADELVELLQRLGYSESAGVFRHPRRLAIFCGDFIDRGPQIRDTLRIARSMVDHGVAKAVMGNHEYNAITFHTGLPERPGEYFRQHSEHNLHQHSATLQQLTSAEITEAIRWFRTLPVALDLSELRVVHACWDSRAISTIVEAFAELGRFTPEFLSRATTQQDPLFESIERVLKGPEIQLPEGMTLRDTEGRNRRRIRIRWFEPPDGHTLASYAFPPVEQGELTKFALTAACDPAPYSSDDPPVFIGHYWMPGQSPMPLTHNVACLDYSVARDGQLCAYRFDGESHLRAEKFVTVLSRTRRAVETSAADCRDFQRFSENARVND